MRQRCHLACSMPSPDIPLVFASPRLRSLILRRRRSRECAIGSARDARATRRIQISDIFLRAAPLQSVGLTKLSARRCARATIIRTTRDIFPRRRKRSALFSETCSGGGRRRYRPSQRRNHLSCVSRQRPALAAVPRCHRLRRPSA